MNNKKPIEKLFPDHREQIENMICTSCGMKITEFRDELSIREHKISGFCQKCQDSVFGI